MKSQSAKSKGRKFQQKVAAAIRDRFTLPDPDAVSTSMGKSGIDIQLSTAARIKFPFAVECKCQESLNIWTALKQAEDNAQKENLKPLVVFSRNRSDTYVALPLSTFLETLRDS